MIEPTNLAPQMGTDELCSLQVIGPVNVPWVTSSRPRHAATYAAKVPRATGVSPLLAVDSEVWAAYYRRNGGHTGAGGAG